MGDVKQSKVMASFNRGIVQGVYVVTTVEYLNGSLTVAKNIFMISQGESAPT